MIKQIEQLNKQLVDTEKYIQELRVVRDNLFLELGKASTHLSKEIKDIILDKTIPLFERVGILKWKSQEMGKEAFYRIINNELEEEFLEFIDGDTGLLL